MLQIRRKLRNIGSNDQGTPTESPQLFFLDISTTLRIRPIGLLGVHIPIHPTSLIVLRVLCFKCSLIVEVHIGVIGGSIPGALMAIKWEIKQGSAERASDLYDVL